MAVNWGYYKKFNSIMSEFLPDRGEGDSIATQLVTALNKIIYKWYNDGDVYDNTGMLTGWANDLSSYANWIYNNYPGVRNLMDGVFVCNETEYEYILKDLADNLLDLESLEIAAQKPKVGSIYDCDGPYQFLEYDEDEDDDYYDEDEDDY